MTIYSSSAVNEIRKWLWTELTGINGILKQSDYNKPINNFKAVIPIQQIPETNNLLTVQPFIVYDYIPVQRGQDFWRNREEVTFTIYSPDYNKIMEIQEFMKDLFGRQDLSATDINISAITSPFKFFFFEILDALPPDPAKDEDGRFGATFIIAYEYTRKSLKGNGRFAS